MVSASAVVDDFFAAIESADMEEIRRLYTSDVQIWHNDGSPPQDFEEGLQLIEGLTSVVSDLKFEVLRRAEVDGGCLQQHVMRGKIGDREVALDAAMYLAVDVDGRHITRVEEYFDTAMAGPIGEAAMGAGEASQR
jgi:limonene-1,2-epoxide hydrolase